MAGPRKGDEEEGRGGVDRHPFLCTLTEKVQALLSRGIRKNGRGKRQLPSPPSRRGIQEAEQRSTSPPPWRQQNAEQWRGEAVSLNKASFLLILLPGASAREIKSGAKRHHISSTSLFLQEPSPSFIQQVFIELQSTRPWARC